MSQLSDISVKCQAGRRHHDLARRIELIARACAPLVENITGLLLPSRVVVRLVSVGEYIDSCRKHRQRVFTAEMQELAPSTESVSAALQELQRRRKADGLFWLWSGAQTILAEDGSAEILMVPKGLRHAGVYNDDWWLHLALAHELCHPAQQRASEDKFLTLRATPFPLERGVDGLALAELTEGHAMWAGRKARTKLLGEPPASQDPRKTSLLYRRYQKKAGPSADAVYVDGEDFTARVLDELGTDAFNFLWRRLYLTPTHKELATRGEWITRITPHLREVATDHSRGPGGSD